MNGIYIKEVDKNDLVTEIADEVESRFRSNPEAETNINSSIQGVDGAVKLYLSTDEVCKMLDISRPTLYRYINDGLPVIQVKRKNLFKQRDVESWVESKKKAQ